MKEIKEKITEWIDKHNGNVAFVGSLFAFDEGGDVVEFLILGYGDKEIIQIQVDEIQKFMDKEEDDFINW